jgi:hypothetical protein
LSYNPMRKLVRFHVARGFSLEHWSEVQELNLPNDPSPKRGTPLESDLRSW